MESDGIMHTGDTQPIKKWQWPQCVTMSDVFSSMNGWGTGGGSYNPSMASTLKRAETWRGGGNALAASGLMKGWCTRGGSSNVSKGFFLATVEALTRVAASCHLWLAAMPRLANSHSSIGGGGNNHHCNRSFHDDERLEHMTMGIII